VFYTKASGQPSIPYIYAVEEALCYGWIDSIAKKLGADSRAQHFPPRHRGSPMSEMNKARVRRLAEAVLVSPSAMESLATILDEPYQVPVDIEAALQADETVWRNFQAFPEGYKRIPVGWLDGSRNPPKVCRRAPRLFREDDEAEQAPRHGAVNIGRLKFVELGCSEPNVSQFNWAWANKTLNCLHHTTALFTPERSILGGSS
jgi:Bacteriocin-protection, YdeI or OmpD-Associated